MGISGAVYKPPEADLWVEAIQQLDDDDKSLIWPHATDNLTVLDDVLTSAKERQEECKQKRWKYKRRDGREVELRGVFDKIVEKVAQFKDLGDSVAALDSTHLAVPWGAIKLVLQFAVKDSEYLHVVYGGIEMLTVFIPRYMVFERLYLQGDFQIKSVLQREIIKLYSSALRFMAKAKAYYAMGTAKRIAKGFLQIFSTFEDLIKEIEKQQVIVEDLARLVDSENSQQKGDTILEKLEDVSHEQDLLKEFLKSFQDPITSMTNGIVDLQRRSEGQEEKNILNWLSPISHSGHHQRLRTDRLPVSGLWVFDQPEYVTWRTSNRSSLLWLHGYPGTGKSTLM
ncbi:uncharacterized protein LDX57_010063 [Aspergillus melleus]|uniref:uncharacterized protein n=1 Tax=Aspergillus melleus TaxID=138277 RepID=UPI001E8E2612|nr:uncharacterized protein LDX57_010063 [Aspergillus melleus]KAH8432427.1 hypothetical protein LDX57_010063 [Aspergillus melleus]